MRFQNIQVLRAITALVVVSIHLSNYGEHTFGASGWLIDLLRLPGLESACVPFFFAISGFVLAHALQNTPPGRFLFARYLRIYPGYLVAVGLTLLAVWFTWWPAEYRTYCKPAAIGFSLLPRTPGTFVFVLGVEWSLVYEMVLYVALSAMALFGVRRGVPVLATVWLTVLLAKAYLRPGYANDVFPVWATVWLSSFIIPFWLGLLAYYVRDRGRRWRWVIGAGLVAFVAKVPWMARHQEQAWLAWGVAAVVAVWFAAAVRQLPQRNVLVWFGDRTYGLYLVHVPVTLTTFYLLRDRGWLVGTTAGVAVTGVVVLVLGALYGDLECRLHNRFRPLTKLDVRGWLGRTRGRLVRWTGGVRSRNQTPA